MRRHFRFLRYMVMCGFALVASGAGATHGAGDPDPLEILGAARAKYDSIQDYTATFNKQQRVGGTLYGEETILLKFKKPFMVYMKWIGSADTGREALWVKGKNTDRLLVHLGGMGNYFAPSFLLHPTGMLAMRKNLRPITESGMGSTITLILGMCEKAKKAGDLKIKYIGTGEIGGVPTWRFERLLPQKAGYSAHRMLLETDQATGFPLSVTNYGWKGELLEKYL
ncbi:MAG: DUF1571 domain-containing protein, partial [Candidatus Aureabacteria bacterium]|nr:DUF1571 domain-containing protein [Candidatus Auribacterota bacterium]